MTQWHTVRPGNFFLDEDGESVAAVSYIERDGIMGWFWHTYINGDEGFCETLEEAKANAERSTSTVRMD